ncbi:MAG: transglutaminaseTgpA domain-containing protein, partial [Terriglobales bacterium]
MRRYCDGLLLMLLATGFATLASTGELGWPVVAAAGAMYAAQLAAFWRGRRLEAPQAAWALTLLFYLPVYVADGYWFSGSFMAATLRLVVLAGAAKLFTGYRGREAMFLGLLAFLEVLTAALVTVSGVFFVLFLLFLVLLVTTLVAHEMLRAEASPQPPPAGLWRPLLRFSLWLSAAVAMASVVIFFLLPRITAGAWSAHAASGLSGFSDEVQLGAIARLQRTNQPVMHIRLTTADPSLDPAVFQQIPWRGRGLTTFDGRRWYSLSMPDVYGTRGGTLEVGRLAADEAPEIVRYQVELEPLGSPVLFFPAHLLRASTHFPALSWDQATGTLASLGSDFSGAAYSGVSDIATPPAGLLRAAPGLSRMRYRLEPYLQLPPSLDERIPMLARQVVARTPGDNWDRLEALTQYLQTNFQYTLDHLPQGPDPLATFLFDQQSGDCEYFATALAVMARTLGIPTRLVNGFEVGSYNPLTGEYLVRGGDAHTWVEAYFMLPGRRGRLQGQWVSFDPTPAAPAAAAGMFPKAGMLLDAFSSWWQSWIVNYDWIRQGRLAQRLLGQLSDGVTAGWQAAGDGAASAWQRLSSGGAAGTNDLPWTLWPA